MIEVNKIYNEDCLTTLSRMDDNCIDCIVTSYCFGKKCYSFGIYWSKLRKCFAKYGFKTDADEVLKTMMHNSNPIRFFGIIKIDPTTMYDLFND